MFASNLFSLFRLCNDFFQYFPYPSPEKTWPPAFTYPQYVNAITNHLGCYRRCFFHWKHCSRVPASNLHLFTHSRHSSVNPGDKSMVCSLACRCTTPVIACVPVSVIKLVLRGGVISPTPNPQPGGPGFFCRGCPSLSHGFWLLKAPDTRLPPLSLGCQRLLALPGVTDDEDVRHMTSLAEPVWDGKALLSISE